MPPRRRIVYVWDADYPWDVRTEKICLALTQAGHDVHIVARNRKWSPEVEQLPEGTVHRMPPWRRIGKRLDGLLGFPAFLSPRWNMFLARVVRSTRADLIIARDLPLCPIAIRIGRSTGIPVILDMAENYPAMMRDIWTSGRQRLLDAVVRNPIAVEWVERHCIARVDRILTVVEESSERLVRMGVPQDRVHVVSNTPSRQRLRAHPVPPSRTDGGIDIVYLGLMEVPRGVGDAIEAIALLRRQGHQVSLRLIGSGRDITLFREQAARLSLTEDDVTFYGYVPYSKALEIVEHAHIGLIPHHATESWNTTIPNKLFDYMAAGLPVLSSDAVPCTRVLSETKAGTIFRSRDPGDLASAIIRLLDPATRAAAATAGQQAIRGRYNWEYDTHTLLTVVEAL